MTRRCISHYDRFGLVGVHVSLAACCRSLILRAFQTIGAHRRLSLWCTCVTITSDGTHLMRDISPYSLLRLFLPGSVTVQFGAGLRMETRTVRLVTVLKPYGAMLRVRIQPVNTTTDRTFTSKPLRFKPAPISFNSSYSRGSRTGRFGAG